ncbi:MAG: twin-arginine translocation signal domain-containing protein [Betaproteobacteria bacterium]|nr:twin-arginine translocation signal domain-containing protein [Betaproteobacteria bacterium]
MKGSQSKLSRRNFLLAVGAGGAAATAALVAGGPQTQSKKNETVSGSKGYHLTDHIRKYYSTTKV